MITLEKYREQIDAYFENTPPSEIIKRFEELGYEFEPIDVESKDNDSPLAQVNQQAVNMEELSMFDSKEQFTESSKVTTVSNIGISINSNFLKRKRISHKTQIKSNVLLDDFNTDVKYDVSYLQNKTSSDDESQEKTPYAIAA